MRKAVLLVAVIAALVCAGAAGATAVKPPSPQAACGPTCNGGQTGWTGCANAQNSHSGFGGVVYFNHYLVVSYCKRNGIITSLSIAAHGCDVRGTGSCSPGPAWLTGGGVGYGWATFEAHASWVVYELPFVTNSDTLTLTISPG